MTSTEALEQTLAASVARLRESARLCVALSGGRDSVVLLHALARLAATGGPVFRLSALHVHHGLSARADAWADFCAAFCASLGVPLDIVRVAVPRGGGEGIEGAARRVRHAVFAACAADYLALAHHRDDQAETVLLKLLRGAGVAGAAGMSAARPAARGKACLLRPWLDAPRRLIKDYAKQHELSWVEDESNADAHFRRNFLRREIIPRLEERFPSAQKALARAAGHFAEAAGLLDEVARTDRAAVGAPSGRLALSGFNALAPAHARNLLRHEWVGAGFRAPDARWIDEALRQLAAASAASETRVSTPDGELRVYRGEIHLVGHSPAPPDTPVPWSGEDAVPWAGGCVRFIRRTGEGIGAGWLTAERVLLKPRQGGERLQPHPRRPRRSLRDWCQAAGVPPWERARLPLLWVGERLVWAGGLGVDVAFACAAGEEGVLPLWEACVGEG